MKKKLTALACILTMTCCVLMSGCRSVSVSSKAEKTTDEETTTKSKKSNKETTDETTTKKSEKETTTKKGSGEDSTLAWDSSADTSSWKTYSKTGYSIKINEDDWTEGVAAGADFAVRHNTTGSGAFAENINVVIQDVSAYKMDLEAYKELSFKQYDQLNYDILSDEKVDINGSEGYYITINYDKDGTLLAFGQYFTIVDNKAYVFTLTADEDDFDDLEEEFFNILYTIHFDSLA